MLCFQQIRTDFYLLWIYYAKKAKLLRQLFLKSKDIRDSPSLLWRKRLNNRISQIDLNLYKSKCDQLGLLCLYLFYSCDKQIKPSSPHFKTLYWLLITHYLVSNYVLTAPSGFLVITQSEARREKMTFPPCGTRLKALCE